MPEDLEFKQLSSYQRRALWLLSQGHSIKTAAAVMEKRPQSVSEALFIARGKLRSTSDPQAVLVAYRAGIIGVREDCGTRTAYVRHLDSGEDACPACRVANVRWLKAQNEPDLSEPLEPQHIKLLQALHGGRTHGELQQTWNISRAHLHREIQETYRRLGVSTVPKDIRREAAFREAQRRGHLRPVAVKLPKPVLPPSTQPITARELETLIACDGHTLTEAGQILGMPRSNVSSRLGVIYSKLGVAHIARNDRRRAALLAARRMGYIQ